MAAHEEARRLDPHVPTSVAYTLYLMGDYERLAREGDSVIDLEPQALGLLAQGRREEALRPARSPAKYHASEVFRRVADSMRAYVTRDTFDLGIVEAAAALHSDPEALYMIAIFFGGLGHKPRAVELLERAVRRGYLVSPALRRDPLLEPLRTEPDFVALIETAEAGRLEAQRAFEDAGGKQLLGL